MMLAALPEDDPPVQYYQAIAVILPVALIYQSIGADPDLAELRVWKVISAATWSIAFISTKGGFLLALAAMDQRTAVLTT